MIKVTSSKSAVFVIVRAIHSVPLYVRRFPVGHTGSLRFAGDRTVTDSG